MHPADVDGALHMTGLLSQNGESRLPFACGSAQLAALRRQVYSVATPQRHKANIYLVCSRSIDHALVHFVEFESKVARETVPCYHTRWEHAPAAIVAEALLCVGCACSGDPVCSPAGRASSIVVDSAPLPLDPLAELEGAVSV